VRGFPAAHAKWEFVLANWRGYNCRADASFSS